MPSMHLIGHGSRVYARKDNAEDLQELETVGSKLVENLYSKLYGIDMKINAHHVGGM
jgi:hypothetical protein